MNRKLKGEEQFSAEALVLEESMKWNVRSVHPLPRQTLKNRRMFLIHLKIGHGSEPCTEQKFELDSYSEGGVRVAVGDRTVCYEENDGSVASDASE
jgi:hypothetical protein